MLFLLATPDARQLEVMDRLAGNEDKELLLISDGVYLACEAQAALLARHDIGEVYAEEPALAKRGVRPSADCEAVDMARIVDLILDSGKLINL
ncbi:MAG: DsrH/TusB family sulfur metabolism protein [Pseudomonadota bacterium]